MSSVGSTETGGYSETLFSVVERGATTSHIADSWKYCINFDARFKYIDYQELKLARDTASSARKLAILAIIVAILVPILTALFVTQSVKIETGQLEEVKASVEEALSQVQTD